MADAELLDKNRYLLSAVAFADTAVWRLPVLQIGCNHNYKYRLALMIESKCVMRYDNEAGKGDHWHSGKREYAYRFVSLDDLYSDFWDEVEKWRPKWER